MKIKFSFTKSFSQCCGSCTNLTQALPPCLLQGEDGFLGGVAQGYDRLDEVSLLLAQCREQVSRGIWLGSVAAERSSRCASRGEASVGAEGLQGKNQMVLLLQAME